MKLLGTIELETNRLNLRRFRINDADDMFYGWASLEKCTRYFPWNPSQNKQEVTYRINNWIKKYEDKEYYQWAIELKSTNTLIGVINLHNVDVDNNSAETSYILNPEYWNNGYMTESLNRVLKFAFENLELNRIYADYFVGNNASEKVLKKNGMRTEGIARQKYFKNGQYIDSVQCAILASQWKN